jgi:translation initiation factor IF-3
LIRPPGGRPSAFFSGPRVNGKIRAREVRVIGDDGKQLGILPLNEALAMARQQGVDLVEIAPNATPPVCRVVDFGKFRYEQSKREKESKKHQHANKVKEVQLSVKIDPHDLEVKRDHAVGFLCEEMKVKVSLRFRGREMAHTEIGFQVVNKFLSEVGPWGTPDREPQLVGKGINVMISPLPRNKRAKPLVETAETLAAKLTPPNSVPAPPVASPVAPQKIIVNPFASGSDDPASAP